MITKAEIQKIQKEVSPIVAKAESYEIVTAQDVDKASGYLRDLQTKERAIEAKRLEFTAPLNQSLKTINETFKLLKLPIIEARKVLTDKILAWRRAEDERIRKEEERRRKIQEAHAEKGHDVNAPVILERPETKIGNAQVSKVWKWKIIDQSQVPDQYKVVNPVLVNQAIRNGVREIAGIEIFQEETLSVVGR